MKERRFLKLLDSAHIPKRYEHASFDNYETDFPGAGQSLQVAKLTALRYAQDFLISNRKGLLLHGSIGAGKTHLAVSVIRELVGLGVGCVFVDQLELLKRVQQSYSDKSNGTEMQLLSPVLESEIIVLDDLGLMKATDWAAEMISLILTTRYNAERATIITTNFPVKNSGMANVTPITGEKSGSEKYTLGDRITDRVLSRLMECCILLEVNGSDFRSTIKKARHL